MQFTIASPIALIAWLSLTLGLCLRRNPRCHVPCMLFGMGLDLLLVLYLEFARGAVEKVLGESLALFHQLHVAFSTLAVLLYFPILYLGLALWKGSASPRQRLYHRRFGLSAYTLRSIGFLFLILYLALG